MKGLRDGSIPLKIATFVTARDYIIAFSTLDNMSRPSGIENMTLGEFELTKRQKRDAGSLVLQNTKPIWIVLVKWL